MSEEQIICCFCNEPIPPLQDKNGNNVWWEGNNAEPIKEGRCCNPCNDEYVFKSRKFIMDANDDPSMMENN